jgi:2-polyprenyl-3-methyl-5-hydroxy-6-metoxy-1,4-benzoquinol methylase
MTDEVEQRARRSGGVSNAAIYQMVARALQRRDISGACLLDVGCGAGHLYPYVKSRFGHYAGADVVAYEAFPHAASFFQIDLDGGNIPLNDGCADVAAAIETIEHLENPRAFCRKLVRLVKPGGWVIVTTPNQLSALSLGTLAVKQRFSAFQEVHYPAHRTALLAVDLLRIGHECGLERLEIEYTLSGRIPLTARHYPQLLAKRLPRLLSDNLMLIGRNRA